MARLSVQGPHLVDRSGLEVFLQGINLQFRLGSPFEGPGYWDNAVLKRLPAANALRLVALHWHDGKGAYDCRTAEPPYMSSACAQQLEAILGWSSSLQPPRWAVVTLRGEHAAQEVFRSDGKAVARELVSAWGWLANRMRGRFRIAGYECLSEPRVSSSEQWWVGNFYSECCSAIQAADPGSACIVGAAPYYSIDSLDELFQNGGLSGMRGLVYSFNFFVPKAYVMNQTASSLRYPGAFPCSDVYTVDYICKHSLGKVGLRRPIEVDRTFLSAELSKAVRFREERGVPLLLDQWGVSRAAGSDRARYVSDVAALCESLRVPWAYWSGRTVTRNSAVATDFGLLAVTVNYSNLVAGAGAHFSWDEEALGSLARHLKAEPPE